MIPNSTIIVDYFDKSKKYIGFACFDLDHTLIKPKSGKVFPIDKNDWILMDNIKDTLTQFNNKDWIIIVFTNQSSIDKKISKMDFIYKLDTISNSLSVNIKFIVSTQNDYYRKPQSGMWDIIENEFSYFDTSIKFYSGDAYHPDNKKLNASDYKFAYNKNIPFLLPEILFNGSFEINHINKIIKKDRLKISTYELYKFIPETDEVYNKNVELLNEFIKNYHYLFIISGPSTGKTSFCKKYLSNYIRLSKDDYKTVTEYKKSILKNINNKLIFDNTNTNYKSRKIITDILINSGIEIDKIGYIIREVPKEISLYLNKYRSFITKGKIEVIPDVAIHSYYKNVEYPKDNYIKLSHMIQELEKPNLLF